MQVVRIYSGDDGQSHFEDLGLPYDTIADAEVTAMRSATGVQFRRTPAGLLLRLASGTPSTIRHYS